MAARAERAAMAARAERAERQIRTSDITGAGRRSGMKTIENNFRQVRQSLEKMQDTKKKVPNKAGFQY